MALALKIGIDVGGTHTDAVIVSEKNEILTAVKTYTTPDVTAGIIKSLDLAMEKSGISAGEVKYVSIGTTHCINAVTERRRLAKVATIRICKPAGGAIPPLYRWPSDLREALGGGLHVAVGGGYDYDGRRIGEFSDSEVRSAVRDALSKGVEAFAVVGVFSPVIPDQELRVSEVIRELAPNVHVSVSHRIGRIGLIERENATILNAALFKVARTATEALEIACIERNIDAKMFFSQNDGTLMSVEYAKQYPILTIASGPTNSFRGASFLTGLKESIVVDIGGTTLLAGMLVNGFPRQSLAAIEIGGVRTNFRMPDLVSFGCGGGTVVKLSNGGDVSVGPESVGYELENRALAWGGDTLTTTDVALALGYAKLDDPHVRTDALHQLDKAVLKKALARIAGMLEDAVERVKTRKEPMQMVLVGGGGIIIPPEMYQEIRGVSKVIRPPAFQYANALGAAIAQVGGEIEKVFSLDGVSREEAMKKAKMMAVEEAVRAGARPDSVEVVDIDEVFLAYLPSNAVRIRVKAAGDLKG